MRNLTLLEKIIVLNVFRLIELVFIFFGALLSVTQNIWFVLLTVIGILFFRQHTRMIKKYQAGRAGEKQAGKLLKGLPKGYEKRHHVYVVWNGQKSELDYLVVGPTGVFVIEVKNMSGVIRGTEEDAKWTQNKVLKNGKPFSHAFYSPVKQVRTHAVRLSKKLNHVLEYDQKIWVHGLVLFVHPESKMELEHVQTPVFTEIHPLIHYILNREKKYNRKQAREILSVI